jgi:hypothetical protein
MPGLLGVTDVPWLLTASAFEKVPVAAVREARREVARMLRLCPHLENHVASSYTKAYRFLRALGFTVGAPQPVGGQRGWLWKERGHQQCLSADTEGRD